MATEIYYPPVAEYKYPNAGYLLLPPIGSRNDSDGGRDGQDLAVRTGQPVVMIDLPGGDYLQFRPELKKAISEEYASVMGAYATEASKRIEEANLTRLIGIGRSAGASALLALVRSGVLYFDAFQSYSPPGLFRLPDVKTGRDLYKEYSEFESRLLTDDQSDFWMKPEPTDQHGLAYLKRGGSIILNHASLRYHHEEMWASDHVRQIALEIARFHPQTRGELILPEHSLVAPLREDKNKLRDEIVAARADASCPAWQRFDVVEVLGTVKSSADRRDYIAGEAIRIAREQWE